MIDTPTLLFIAWIALILGGFASDQHGRILSLERRVTDLERKTFGL